MDDLNWEKVEAIIDEVLQLPADQRKRIIEERCGDDKRTKEEVTTLLESIQQSEGWLENPELYKEELFKELSADEMLATPQSFVGTHIGSYIIRKKIGEGGMGTVFLGERADNEFEHRVAIKIIRQGCTTEQNIQRFRREQKILAGMNHPYIARLFDGGVTEDGNPYIIMEHIDGTPITKYCQQKNCSIDEKITVFTQVLEAVRHAHENLVIHRDLKPGNILVTDSGTVKILDFGISKLLEEEDSPAITKAGSRLLTLKYAAPEQILQTNITTATDLYAVGMMFYKLLVNQLPFDFQNKSRFETEQIILNESPQKPSSKTTSHPLKKKLSGDLDAICLKSIRKEPDSRYRIANEFLEDLKNYRNGLPVTARDDTFRYRSQKFLRRHKPKILVAAGFLFLVIGFAVFYTWNITQERNLARQQAERAERERERAEEVTEFMVNLFQTENPENSPNEEMTVQAAMDLGIERLQNSDINPVNQATILGTIAQIEINLGDYERAQELLDQALPIVLDSIYVQNKNTSSIPLIYGQLSYILNDFDKSEELLQISDSLFKANELTNTPDYKILKFNMVGLYNNESRYRESLKVLQDLNPESFGISKEELELKSSYFNYLAIAQKNLGNYREAASNYQKAIEIRKVVFGENNPETATAMNNLANVYVSLEDNSKALELSKSAHEIRMQVYGPNHYLTGSTFHTLHLINKNLENYEGALELAKRAYEANRSSLGDEHIRTILTSRSIADVFRLMNNFDEASKYMEIAISGIDKNYPDNNVFKARIYHSAALLYDDMENIQLAEKYYLDSIEYSKNGYGEIHPNTATVLVDYGSMKMDMNHHENAEILLNEALSIFRELDDPDEEKILEANSLLAKLQSES